MGHLGGGGGLGPNSPKNSSILMKLAPEVDLKERNTVLKFLGEIPSFKPKNQLFVVFWSHPALNVAPKSSVKRKVSWRYTIMPSFIFIASMVLKLYNLKVSGTRKKGDLWLLLGGFWYLTTPNQV